jgi:hypothetical protein
MYFNFESYCQIACNGVVPINLCSHQQSLREVTSPPVLLFIKPVNLCLLVSEKWHFTVTFIYISQIMGEKSILNAVFLSFFFW